METIIEQLKKLGFGNNEALVYGTLLQSSPSSATHIAKKNNLSRSTVYTTLSALIAKGYVGTTYKNDVKQFIAEDVSILQQALVREQKHIETKNRLIQELKEKTQVLRNSSLQIPGIIFFEGQEGLKKIYLSMMRRAAPRSTLYLLRDEFVWRPEWNFIFDEEWQSRVGRWKKEKNIRTKLLVNPSVHEKAHGALYRTKRGLEYRFLPPETTMDAFALYILGDTIAILSIEKNNLIGIQITNMHLAQNFVSVFKGLWRVGKHTF